MDLRLGSTGKLVVDLGASHVACGRFLTGKGGHLTLEAYRLERFDAEPAGDDRWIEALTQAWGRIVQVPALRGPVAAALPGHLALTKFIKTPAVPHAKRDKIVHFEAAQAIPYPLDQVVWDHLNVGEDDTEVEIMLAAVKSEAIMRLCGAACGLGCPMAHASPSCIALLDTFEVNYPEIRQSTLIVDLGARSTQLLFIDGRRFFARTLAFGGNAVTQAVAEELRIDFLAAEKLKLDLISAEGSPLNHSLPWRAVQAAAASFGAKLAGEITRSTLNQGRQFAATAPTAVYLTGGASQLEMLIGTLTEKLKLPVQPLDPFRGVKLSPSARTAGAQRDGAQLAALAGLALQAAGIGRGKVNLLPKPIQQDLSFRRRQPWMVAAAGLAVASLLPPIRYFHGAAATAQRQSVELEAELQPLRRLAQHQTTLLSKISEAQTAVAELQRVVNRKTTWLRFLEDLQNRLTAVEDVWIESLSLRRELPDDLKSPRNEAVRDELRIVLSGRLLDRNHPISKVSPDSYERVNQLLVSFNGSEFITRVEQERFDNSQPGILRFDFTLLVRSPHAL